MGKSDDLRHNAGFMNIRLHMNVREGVTEGVVVALDTERLHYLKNVMRRSVGDYVRVFNAEWGEYDAEIVELAKKRGALLIRRAIRRAETTDFRLDLCIAQVKRAAFEVVIQKATELGVTHITPLVTDRTNASRINPDRLNAIAVEAAEQCERLSVPVIREREALSAMLDARGEGDILVFCDEAGDDETAPWGGAIGRAPTMIEALQKLKDHRQNAAILIGPEGGFSPDERTRLRESPGIVPVTLGPRILRADTAAVAALTIWQAVLGDWRRA